MLKNLSIPQHASSTRAAVGDRIFSDEQRRIATVFALLLAASS